MNSSEQSAATDETEDLMELFNCSLLQNYLAQYRPSPPPTVDQLQAHFARIRILNTPHDTYEEDELEEIERHNHRNGSSDYEEDELEDMEHHSSSDDDLVEVIVRRQNSFYLSWRDAFLTYLLSKNCISVEPRQFFLYYLQQFRYIYPCL
jgi:hypothetical protein